MMNWQQRNIFYNPYLKSSFSFFNQSASNIKQFESETITDINLYYQPLQYPFLATLYLIVGILIIVCGEYLHFKILQLLKQECCLVKSVLQAFMYIQMVFWPIDLAFNASVDFMYPMWQIVGSWYCELGFIWKLYGFTFVVFHSLITGLMRYVFVVHFKSVRNFGKEEMKTLFYWTSLLLPFLITIWAFLDRKEISTFSSIDKCNGILHKSFLREHTIDSTAKRNLCFLEKPDEHENMYLFTIKKTSCTIRAMLFIIMGSNILEGVLYWRTIRKANK